VVGSQTTILTPDPSFVHNLGDRCPNGQCEAIFDIYASRPFQWHREHPNERCFGPCCRVLNIRESRRTPNPHFFQVLGFTPTLGQSRVATVDNLIKGIKVDQYNSIASQWYCKWWYGIWKNYIVARTTRVTCISPIPCLLKCKKSRLFAWFLLDEIRIELIEGYWLATWFVQCRSLEQLMEVEKVYD
jgi:hypothetical protein